MKCQPVAEKGESRMKLVKLAAAPVLAAVISLSGVSGEAFAKQDDGSRNQKIVSEKDVKNKYFPLFKQLENEAKPKLNKLVSDVLSGKKSVLDAVTSGRQLRDEITLKFNELLGNMSQELENNGLENNLVTEAQEEFMNKSTLEKEKIRSKYER